MFRKAFHRNVIIPLTFRLQGSLRLRYYQELLHSQYYNKEKLKYIATKRLRNLLKYVQKNNPYYANVFKKPGFDPEIKSLDDLSKLPVVSKSDMQRDYSAFITRNPRGLRIKSGFTGGSTGEPLRFKITRYSHDYGLADILRHYNWTGWKLGENHAFIWGAERDDPIRTYRGRFHAWALRYKWLNSFRLNPEKMRNFTDLLKQFKPAILIGYASSLFTFASFMQSEGIRIPPLKGVQSSAEKLYDWQRSTLEEVFNCPVYDRYGCREVGNIAHECESHDGLHISEELLHVEILKDGEAVSYGEEGEIIITSFMNYAFPFIRYSLGDVGTLLDPKDQCSCGREMIKLKPTLGRTTDNFYFDNGLIVHGEYFTHLFYGIDSVKQFQVIQKSKNKIVVRVVPIKEPNQVPVRDITEEILRWLKIPIEVKFEFVEHIEPTETGKRRFTVSEVSTNS